MSKHSNLFEYAFLTVHSCIYIYIKDLEQTPLNENSVTNFQDFCERYKNFLLRNVLDFIQVSSIINGYLVLHIITVHVYQMLR